MTAGGRTVDRPSHRQWINSLGKSYCLDDGQRWPCREWLLARLPEYEAALSWYADASNYHEQPAGSPNQHGMYESSYCPIYEDEGETARDALAHLQGTATKCSDCGGTGREKYGAGTRTCYYCDGSGLSQGGHHDHAR